MLNAIATGAHRLPAHARPARRADRGPQQHRRPSRFPSPVRFPGFQLIPAHRRLDVYGFIVVAVAGRRRLLVRAQPHPLRLRPARHRASRDRRRGQRRQRQADGRHDDAALRRGRRPGRHAEAARRVLHLQHWTSRPASASPASPSPCSAATTRSASRSARCCSPSSTSSSQILDLDDVPKEIVTIMQGVIVLSVVIAYELVRRYRVRAPAARGRRGSSPHGPTPPRSLRRWRHDAPRRVTAARAEPAAPSRRSASGRTPVRRRMLLLIAGGSSSCSRSCA